MVKKLDIRFMEAKQPIAEPVTKFGGQPVWFIEPQWPVSRTTGNPMMFISQILLDPLLFGSIRGRMAYIFMADEEEAGWTFDPDRGENAVIIQPGDNSPNVTRPLTSGPSLYRMVRKPSRHRLEPEPCEFAVELIPGEDPELISDEGVFTMPSDERKRYLDSLDGNKIGGTPGFLQGPQFPTGGPWRLLLQLDSNTALFSINFGDVGVGYAFLSEDGKVGKFLWQCC